jgi:chitosanase
LGGAEQAWTQAYLRERQQWLGASARPAVRKSVYRTKDLIREVARENWDLSRLPILANGIAVRPSD